LPQRKGALEADNIDDGNLRTQIPIFRICIGLVFWSKIDASLSHFVNGSLVNPEIAECNRLTGSGLSFTYSH
jgi:hypothetical protein